MSVSGITNHVQTLLPFSDHDILISAEVTSAKVFRDLNCEVYEAAFRCHEMRGLQSGQILDHELRIRRLGFLSTQVSQVGAAFELPLFFNRKRNC